MISRYFISINFAAFITFGLFFGMTLLISNDEIVLLPENKRIPITMGRMPDRKPVEEKIRKPEEFIVEEILDISTSLPSDRPGNVNVTVADVDVNVDPNNGKPSSFQLREHGDYIPLIKPAPQYPVSLAEKGIEGFVLVQFTITETGSTKEVIVIESSHRGFERSAVKAIEKFKYMPQFDDGKSVEVKGVHHRINFSLE